MSVQDKRRGKVGIAVTSVLLGGTLVAGGLVGQATNANALEPKATAALQQAGITGVTVTMKGREAYLSGQGVSQDQLDQAKAAVAAVYGVRWVKADGVTVASPTPTQTSTTTPPPPPPPPSTTPTQPPSTPTTPPGGLTDPEIAQINAVVANFPSGVFTLDDAAKAKLDVIVPLLAKSTVSLDIKGYVSLPNSAATLTSDSLARAQAVADYLTGKGIDPTRIKTEGLGAADPVGDNNTAEGRYQNQRATLTVVKN